MKIRRRLSRRQLEATLNVLKTELDFQMGRCGEWTHAAVAESRSRAQMMGEYNNAQARMAELRAELARVNERWGATEGSLALAREELDNVMTNARLVLDEYETLKGAVRAYDTATATTGVAYESLSAYDTMVVLVTDVTHSDSSHSGNAQGTLDL